MTDSRPTTYLKDIFDISVGSPVDGQVLTYSSRTRKYSPSNSGSGSCFTMQWTAAVNPNNLIVLTANQTFRIAAIIGRLEVANGGASTLTVVKAINGTAVSAGSAMHTGSFNALGTAATNQTLVLITTASKAYQTTNNAYQGASANVYESAGSNIIVNAGDSLGIQTTGVYDTSIGTISIWVTWQ